MVKMIKVALATVGCKVNQYETQVIRERLEKAGCDIVSFSGPAQFYIINTCSVTHQADRKSRQLIKKALKQNRAARILVTGCLAEIEEEKLRGLSPQVEVVKNEEKLNLVESKITPGVNLDLDYTIHGFYGHDRAFVKIEDGCDQFCSYCRIPHVRGARIKSRKPEEIITEIDTLCEAGFQELVLTGVNLALYGKDLPYRFSLTSLLEKIICWLSRSNRKARIRLSSLEPHLIPEGLLDLMTETSFICPHLHLSFQSGDDEILKKMGRNCTVSRMLSVIDKFKSRVPCLGLSGDVIVGFPGEGEKNFLNTCSFIKEAGFHRLHIFPFSPREETPASRMEPKVREKNKRERVKILKELSISLSEKFMTGFLGKKLPVLIETRKDLRTGYLKGYSHNYIKFLISPTCETERFKGKIVEVRLSEVRSGFALGDIKGKKYEKTCKIKSSVG